MKSPAGNSFNDFAREFSATRTHLWDDLRLPEFTRHLQSGDRVLDLGCGNGRLVQLFSEKNIEYVGLDQSEELIKIAKAKFPDKEFVVGDMTDLPFAGATFDHVYCIAAFHHLKTVTERSTTLKQIQRVLRPGGHGYMMNWNLHSEWAVRKLRNKEIKKLGDGDYDFLVPWKDDKGNVLVERYYHAFTLQELTELFDQTGFTIEGQFYVKKGGRGDERGGENMVSIITS